MPSYKLIVMTQPVEGREQEYNDWYQGMHLPDLVSVCVNEHRNNNQKPEWVGKRDSAYRQCSLHVELYLAKQGKLG